MDTMPSMTDSPLWDRMGETKLEKNYRLDLREKYSEKEYNKYMKKNHVLDWSQLTWKEVGKPFEVKNMSKHRKQWEKENSGSMPVKTSWEYFNKAFHEWFAKDVPKEIQETKTAFLHSLTAFSPADVKMALGEMVKIRLWNFAHRIEDGIWDPRGKRELFSGLDVQKPRILFLGAAEGYEAMQLAAMYPGADIVMVDYDPFCRDVRFGEFPDAYPFLGSNQATGSNKIYYKNDFKVEYIVDDIRSLPFGNEFDIVLSVGLIEHFPDEHKPEAINWHRKFLKPSGYAVMTTPRSQLRSKLYYQIMADVMNHTYRELMTVEQMGMYIYESGFDILSHGYIKVHNAVIAKPR
ncbi:class I SAM-dependent methyltransferase [Heyndrickxia acidicola]|uniref:Class I SAM-dependent methyltransferase n=1 Tax=Heyndrickxia acidicola TaxID=209389 RepID=A0ABU6ME36_9BACI|nr:class I SAM-dependent methyltransferase [Heyndrickxia acidicola]MED1202296.1 class I SAM-dependent methyltransferase [Heyndrickxia acidicola]